MNPCQFLKFSQSAMYTYIQNILHDKYIIYLSRESILIHTIQCSVVTKVKTKKKGGVKFSCFLFQLHKNLQNCVSTSRFT